MTPPNHFDYADEAEAAQRASAWPQAAALWRRAAETCRNDERRDHYLRQANWCEDMERLGNEEF